jgi:hypothetical protein
MEPADLQPASTESAAKGPSERDAPKSPQPPAPTTVPSKKETPRAKAKGSLTETAASDLEKIMAASGETAAASDRAEADTAAPRVIRINELFVFYDPQTRILRAKVELLKNLVAQAPAVIGGHIIIVLKPVGDKHKVTTLPRIPFATDKWSDFAQHGAPFSLEDQKTLYIKTQLSKQPPRQQQLTIYVFDKKQNLLLRETHITKIKLS